MAANQALKRFSRQIIKEDAFKWFSSDPDVPMLWEVNWYAVSPHTSGERRFDTKDEALAFHESVVSGEQSLDQLTEDGDGSDFMAVGHNTAHRQAALKPSLPLLSRTITEAEEELSVLLTQRSIASVLS